MSGAGKSRDWLLYGPLAAGAVAFAIYGILWSQGASEMRRAVSNWAEDQRASGVDVTYEKIATKGFPFFLRGAVSNVTIAEGSTWAWRAPQLNIDALPLALDRLIFSVREPHVVESEKLGRWRITAPDGRASIGGDKEHLWIVDVESGAAEVEKVGGVERFFADAFLLTVAPSKEDHATIEASLAATGLKTRNGAAARKLEAMVAATALEALEVSPQAWRESGGKIEFRRIYLETEESKLQLSGDLSLDALGRLEGVLNVEAINPGPLTLTLAEAGVIKQGDAQKVAAALTLAAIAGAGKVSAPLVFENGAARIAGVKVAKLKPVY